MSVKDYSTSAASNTAISGIYCGASMARADVDGVLRQLQADEAQYYQGMSFVPVTLYGATGNGSTDDTAAIQAALDGATVGSTIIFPPGSYKTTATLNMTRFVNLMGHRAQIRGTFSSTTTDLLSINIADTDNTDCRGLKIHGFKALTFDAGGRHAIFLGDAGANVANINCIIENNIIETLDTSTGYAIYLDAVGTHFNTIRNNSIANGIYLACADGTVISENLLYGVRTAVTLDLIPGSFQTRILNNGIVARDGALKVIRGSQWLFANNQVEQFTSYGANQSAYKAHVSVVGTAEPNVCHSGKVLNNNFGGGAYAERSIAVVGYCEDLLIDGNTMNLCTLNGTNADITIYDTTCKYTRIGPNNMPRGARSGITIDANGVASANTSNPAELIALSDGGTGTYGVWQALSFSNSWTGSSVRYKKTLDDEVMFEGQLQAGTVTGGTAIATLPANFRPKNACRIYGPDLTNGGMSYLAVSTLGAITVQAATAGATIDLTGARISVVGRSSYSPGL